MGNSVSIKKAVLFVNNQKEKAKSVSLEIKKEIEGRGIECVIFSFKGKPQAPPQGQWDIAFSLGGDGTVLYTARCLAPKEAPILPIHLGSLGFIASVNVNEWKDVFDKWAKGEISASRRCMLQVCVERQSKIVMRNICLNDFVVSATGIAKLINLDVSIGSDNAGDEFLETEVVSYRCDGLIISTPTGSTAYSMAAGGPILDPEMEAVIINPICPFAISNRPFVLSSRQPLMITVAQKQKSGVLLTVDGQDIFDLKGEDKIYIRQASVPALLIFANRHSYYSALKTKLFFGANYLGGVNA